MKYRYKLHLANGRTQYHTSESNLLGMEKWRKGWNKHSGMTKITKVEKVAPYKKRRVVRRSSMGLNAFNFRW